MDALPAEWTRDGRLYREASAQAHPVLYKQVIWHKTGRVPAPYSPSARRLRFLKMRKRFHQGMSWIGARLAPDEFTMDYTYWCRRAPFRKLVQRLLYSDDSMLRNYVKICDERFLFSPIPNARRANLPTRLLTLELWLRQQSAGASSAGRNWLAHDNRAAILGDYPTFNRVEPLHRAIVCVLTQSQGSFELLVIDDASTPPVDLGGLPQDERLRMIRHEENGGVSRARNTGMEHARGDFIAFLDSDDEWHPEKLARFAQYLAPFSPETKIFAMSQSVLRMPDGSSDIGLARRVAGERFDEFVYAKGFMAQISSFVLSRGLAGSIRFHEELRQFEDQLFFIEAGSASEEFVFIPEPLAVYDNSGQSDRLSIAKRASDCETLLRLGGDTFSRKAKLAFQVRYHARLIMKDEPMRALRLFAEASRTGHSSHGTSPAFSGIF